MKEANAWSEISAACLLAVAAGVSINIVIALLASQFTVMAIACVMVWFAFLLLSCLCLKPTTYSFELKWLAFLLPAALFVLAWAMVPIVMWIVGGANPEKWDSDLTKTLSLLLPLALVITVPMLLLFSNIREIILSILKKAADPVTLQKIEMWLVQVGRIINVALVIFEDTSQREIRKLVQWLVDRYRSRRSTQQKMVNSTQQKERSGSFL